MCDPAPPGSAAPAEALPEGTMRLRQLQPGEQTPFPGACPGPVTEAEALQGCYGSYKLPSETSVYYYRFDAVPKTT